MSGPGSLPWLLWVCLALCVAGLALALWGWRGDRARGRKRCPTCWYDLSATAQLLCPECGWRGTREAELFRPRRNRLLIVLGLLLVLASAGTWIAFGGGWRAVRRLLTPAWAVAEQVQIPGGYLVQRLDYQHDDNIGIPHMVRVLQHGQTVWQMGGGYFEIGGQLGPVAPTSGKPSATRAGIGTDVTGDGTPDLVIVMNTGGSGGYAEQYIFELDARSPIASIQPHSVIRFPGWFEHDPVPPAPGGLSGMVFVAFDPTFAYWWTSGAGSPRPRVKLRCEGSHWCVALDLMRTPAPNREQMDAWAQAIRKNTTAEVESWVSPLLDRVLTLIYSGHADLALDLWKASVPTGSPTLANHGFNDVLDRLRTSPFAAEIQALQRVGN